MNHAPPLSSPRPDRSPGLAARLRLRLLGISPAEASFERRGFAPCEPSAQARLEGIGRTFIHGYRAALAEEHPDRLAAELGGVDLELRGFAFEGAAMGLALLDHLLPWRRDRLARFLRGPGDAHAYMVHVGAGWALARLGRPIDESGPTYPRIDAAPHPLLRWLALDGYGFHEGYFQPERCFGAHAVPARLRGYARRAFDQGLGRCLWFVSGANARKAATAIETFAATRRSDLWSGVGLAAAYAGGLDRAGLESLLALAEDQRAELSQGAAFAAKARQRAGNPAPHTGMAAEVLCGMTASAAAQVTDRALVDLSDGPEPAYEAWRRRVQARFARAHGPPPAAAAD